MHSSTAFPPLTHAEELEPVVMERSPKSLFSASARDDGCRPRFFPLDSGVAQPAMRRGRVGSTPASPKLSFPPALPGSASARSITPEKSCSPPPQSGTPRRLDALSRPALSPDSLQLHPTTPPDRRPMTPPARRRSVGDLGIKPKPGWLTTSPEVPRRARTPPMSASRSGGPPMSASRSVARGIDRPKESVGFKYSAKYDISIVLLMRAFYLEIVADGTANEQRRAFYAAQRKPQYHGIPVGAFESLLEDANGKGLSFRMLLKFMFPLANKKDLEHMTEVCFPTEDHAMLTERHRRELTELFKRHDVDGSGTLTLAEVMCGLSELQLRHEAGSVFGTFEEQSFALLKDLDRNGDGQISLEEFLDSDVIKLLRHRRIPGT
eukprot:TRINITY_DN3102_c0_g1_i1.p1 TRINITY_DN3102_c0_g1~~TRINITY_DN3102_c0_g1_i1.p1  ORF type:complete len:379 (+),score=85.62 TRINITY_DN3102_c0_g1_i1:134-1270(+)